MPRKTTALSTSVKNAPAGGMLSMIERAASNPQVDVDKLEKLIALQERAMQKEAEIAFNQAMTRLQKKLPAITKKGKIEFTDKKGTDRQTPFAKYEDIFLVIGPLLQAEGFHLSFNSTWNSGDGVIISGTLHHNKGHFTKSEMRLPLDTSGSKNNLQAMGSTLSYGKRYLSGMLLNLITKDEDDDGATHKAHEGPGFADKVKEQAGAKPVTDAAFEEVKPVQGFPVILDDDVKNKRFKTVDKAANYLISSLEKIKEKQKRLDILLDNRELLVALEKANDSQTIAALHAAANKGGQ